MKKVEEFEDLSFNEMLVMIRARIQKLEFSQPMDLRRIDANLVTNLEEFRHLEAVIIQLLGKRYSPLAE